MDVVGLYPHIAHEEGLEALEKVMRKSDGELPVEKLVSLAVAKPAREFSHAMQILNHHSFLYKLIVFPVYEHGNICIA
jgi:hypothetical protein